MEVGDFKNLENINQQLGEIIEKLISLISKVNALDNKVETLDDRLIYLGQDIKDLKRESLLHSDEIGGIAEHIDQKFAQFGQLNQLKIQDKGEDYKA